jgi:hypothetical protein
MFYLCKYVHHYIVMVNKRRISGKENWGERYSVLSLGGKSVSDDIGDSLTFSCTNKKILARNTDIPYDRLVYIFTRLKRTCLIENDYIIIKSTTLYKGNQIGGLRNYKLLNRGND